MAQMSQQINMADSKPQQATATNAANEIPAVTIPATTARLDEAEESQER